MYTAKISAKGWVVIPKTLRDKYGFKSGTRVRVTEFDNFVALVPIPDDPVAALYGMFADGPSLTEELLAERASERIREDHKDD